MKQIICILALLLMSVTTTKAQTSPATPSIRGKILTEEKQPIEFANIALLSEDSTFIQGTCSRSDGSFELLPPTPGNYLLQVSSIGYKALCQPCPTGSTHNWILQTDAVLLAETVITAARPVFRLKGGKLETSVRQTLLASLNDANDVLKHIPGLRSSDEGYTVFGKGTPVIYIDNRLLQDNSELQRLSAADIEKVELITNPGAEYDATVKAVVRIRTVRNKRDSFGGNFRAGITQRRRNSHYGQVNLNYQKKGLSLLGMLYTNYENRKRHQEVRYQIPSEIQWDVNNRVHLYNKGLLAGGKASASYDFTPQHSLGASYEFHRTPDYHSSDHSAYTVRANEELADYTFIRRNDNFLNRQHILPDTDSRIDESKSAVFAEYSLTLGKISLLAGLRFEHAVSDYWEQEKYVSGQSRTYNDWCPNLSVDFPLGKAQANLSYTAKSNRPSFFQLRSTLSYNNRFIYEGGNPLLTPETNHDLQFTALYKWVQFGLNYQYRRNAIAFMTKEYEDNPDVVIFTTGNFKRMQYLTASAHLSPTVGIWKPELGIYFAQPFFKVTNQGSSKNMNRGSIYLFLQNSLQLPDEWTLSLDADYQSEGNFGAMLQRSYWGIDAGIRKTFFNKRLTLGLQANDLWNSRYGSFMLFGPRLTYTKKANPDSRSFSLNLSYRFNAAGKAYKGKHVSEQDLKRL